MKRHLSNLVYLELSYQIIGCAYEVYNSLGYGYHEKIYQRALADLLSKKHFKFTQQLYAPIIFNQVSIGRQFFDFLVEDKVVVELKQGSRLSRIHIQQLFQYLVTNNLKLGLLIYFAPQQIIYKRIINLSN